MTAAEIISIIESHNLGNVICRNIALRPKILAMYIAMLANTSNDFGYIFMGVEKDGDAFNINGISKEFRSEQQLQKALAMLVNPPNTEFYSVLVDGKNVFAIKIINSKHDVFFDMQLDSDNNIDLFIKDMLKACVKLQSNIHYRNVSEDTRNDHIRDLLSMKNYAVIDQTRRGYSATGKSAGEVDILIEVDGMPFTLIEALNLSSLDTNNLSKHIDKIFGYDMTGHKFNICLSYVEAKNFGVFWEKYCKYVASYRYPHSLIDARIEADKDFPYSEIRFMVTTHNRSGKVTLLYHIAVKL